MHNRPRRISRTGILISPCAPFNSSSIRRLVSQTHFNISAKSTCTVLPSIVRIVWIQTVCCFRQEIKMFKINAHSATRRENNMLSSPVWVYRKITNARLISMGNIIMIVWYIGSEPIRRRIALVFSELLYLFFFNFSSF